MARRPALAATPQIQTQVRFVFYSKFLYFFTLANSLGFENQIIGMILENPRYFHRFDIISKEKLYQRY